MGGSNSYNYDASLAKSLWTLDIMLLFPAGGGGGPGPGRVSSFCRPTLKINTKCRRFLLCGSISLLFVFDGHRDKVSLSSLAGLEWETVLRGVGPELVISSLPHLPGGGAQFSIH